MKNYIKLTNSTGFEVRLRKKLRIIAIILANSVDKLIFLRYNEIEV